MIFALPTYYVADTISDHIAEERVGLVSHAVTDTIADPVSDPVSDPLA